MKVQPKIYDRLEFLPGEETPVDYDLSTRMVCPKIGKPFTPRLLVMNLRYSDNLKEGVIESCIYELELNSLYTAFLKHYEVVVDPARV